MNKVCLILHKPYRCIFHFKTAYTQVKAKYLEVSEVFLYYQTNYNTAIMHTETTLGLSGRYYYYRIYCHKI